MIIPTKYSVLLVLLTMNNYFYLLVHDIAIPLRIKPYISLSIVICFYQH